MTATVS